MRIAVVLLALLSLTLGGLSAYLYFYDADADVVALRAVNKELGDRVELLAAEQRRLTADLESRLDSDEAADRARIERVRDLYEDLVDELKEEIQRQEVRIQQLADQLTVRILDKQLFETGSAQLTREGYRLLLRVGKQLQSEQGQVIRIEGHTDNVPVGPNVAPRYASNWELSAARALTVARFLVQETGTDPRQVQAMGLSEYHPVADNRTEAGRQQNRRIEIRVMPPSPVAGGRFGQ